MLEIRTARLRLVATTVDLLDAELRNDGSLSVILGVREPLEWPPIGGEHDRDAVEFFRSTLLGDASTLGWLAYYVCLDDELVGSAGYFGPPNGLGATEIGYSVSQRWRRRGIATEAILGLVDHAQSVGASLVIARTRPDNIGSIQALLANLFVPAAAESQRAGYLRFDRPLN